MSHGGKPTPTTGGSSGRVRMYSLLAIAAAFLLSSCDVKYRAFEPVNPAPLEGQLQLGKAQRADVRAALGEPTGSGRSMLPLDKKPRTLWTYFYEEGSLEASGRTMVLVYFDDDAYAGYLWFSSLPTKGETPSH